MLCLSQHGSLIGAAGQGQASTQGGGQHGFAHAGGQHGFAQGCGQNSLTSGFAQQGAAGHGQACLWHGQQPATLGSAPKASTKKAPRAINCFFMTKFSFSSLKCFLSLINKIFILKNYVILCR